jgi:anti-sigma factor RsiW
VNCQEATLLVPAYADGELDALQSVDVERHVVGCAQCAAQYDALLALRHRVRSETPYYGAPASLVRRVASLVPAPAAGPALRATRQRWTWLLAGAAAGSLATWLVLLGPTAVWRDFDGEAIARQIVTSHVGATRGDRLVTVATSDRHTVKPWLSAHLDYAPPVKDLAASGFPLRGARLDLLDGRPVAALVYGYREHTIDVFVRPAEGSARAPALATVRGFNVVRTRQAGMEWWAVSDVNAETLLRFASEFGAAE